MIDRMRLAQRAWRYRTQHDPIEIRELIRRTPPRGVAIDIGAHKGAYTWWLRKRVGRAGRVVSVEPQKELAASLERIYARDRAVTVRHGAVAPETGTATLRIPGSGPSHGASIAKAADPTLRERRVEAWSLADLIELESLERVDAIKCDCEGAEVDIFRAGVGVLERFRPVVLVECERRHAAHTDDPVGALAAVFCKLGYHGHCCYARTLVPIDAFDYDRHQRDPRDKRRYGNNFLFTPGE